jgi:hypothetical protein
VVASVNPYKELTPDMRLLPKSSRLAGARHRRVGAVIANADKATGKPIGELQITLDTLFLRS